MLHTLEDKNNQLDKELPEPPIGNNNGANNYSKICHFRQTLDGKNDRFFHLFLDQDFSEDLVILSKSL